MHEETNVLGTRLIACCLDPVTGYMRDGYCRTIDGDQGRHLVCAVMTSEFLAFSRSRGNDLITPMPSYQFPGLKPGDKWCLCIDRWIEAYQAGVAPNLYLEACNSKILEKVSLDILITFQDPASNTKK